MKPRIKIDSAILCLVIILTGFLYQFPQLYGQNLWWDQVLDFLGFATVIKGTYLRMVARGHKKAHSRKSKDLVTAGPYQLTRNPMYFGSYLMGAGFVLMVWPWWGLVIFSGLFYLRFQSQIHKEEEFLSKTFGETYQKYCRQVPRLFPRIDPVKTLEIFQNLPREEAWSTHEKRGLLYWPLLAVALETFQEKVIFGVTDIETTLLIFAAAGMTFTVGLLLCYVRK